MKSIRLVAAAFAALLATSAIAEAQTTTAPPRAARPVAPAATTPTAPAATTAPKVKKPASAAQLRQRQKMKDCGAEWQGIKKAKTENGRTWRVFSKECLSRKA